MGSFLSKASSTNPSTPEQQQRLHVAIIGAGIGGLGLAIALNNQHVSYTIYESAAEYATVGAGIGIGPNAMQAMDLLDERFRGKYDAICIGNLTSGKEKVMMEACLLEDGLGAKRGWLPRPWGSSIYKRTAAHRKTLLDIMTSFIPKNTIKVNKRVASAIEKSEGVELRFEDGEIAFANAVIGCDGVKGFSRGYVLGSRFPEEVQARYIGQYAYRAVVPIQDARDILGGLADDAKMYFGHRANLSTYVISEGREINVVGFIQDCHSKAWADPNRAVREVTREQMLEDFTSHNTDNRLLKLLDATQWAMFHHPQTSTYHNGLVCLLGDSAHATLPNQAAGAGQGLEDAVIMSRVLGKVDSELRGAESPQPVAAKVMAAFEAYDSIRRPRAQRQIDTSIECGQLYNMTHPGIGQDMEKTMDNLDGRFEWLWGHDLRKDIELALEQYALLVTQKQ
ncbi:hypothetical protein LTR53_005866 [Teratosphaeriaceae sp. CCFEE 6253]|nr:hypothetical protein LTR53_005866 [Teratosphaeriaceae sp. CCFEE 6253]